MVVVVVDDVDEESLFEDTGACNAEAANGIITELFEVVALTLETLAGCSLVAEELVVV